MLDPKFIRENPDIVRKALWDRNDDPNLIDRFIALDEGRRKLIQDVEKLKCEKNETSKKIGEMIRQNQDTTEVKANVGIISEKITVMEEELRLVEGEYKEVIDKIPNIPHESVPIGTSEKDNKLIKEIGHKPEKSFTLRDHLELGKMNGLFDFERGSKISGSGFPVFTGIGAKLVRSLINFMLDMHSTKHKYKEVFPPVLVNRKSMRGTGQLPKLEQDMYKVHDEELFLVPTAEVPVTNLHADEVIPEEDLPICYTAYTSCFRKEAGSYGKDTKGLIRVHQFDKVELVKFVKPENSQEELINLREDAEDILKSLGLPYRVISLCTGDISFAAQKCFDIELWAPGSERWLEVSSCSVFC